MSDNSGELPRDPFSSYDAERIAKETGGQITGSVVWEGKTRLTVGATRKTKSARWSCTGSCALNGWMMMSGYTKKNRAPRELNMSSENNQIRRTVRSYQAKMTGEEVRCKRRLFR